MPVRQLPPSPSLDHLKYQAKDLQRGLREREPEVAQRLREFHPNFDTAMDAGIFSAKLSLADAQLTIAREYGFTSWKRLKSRVEKLRASDEFESPRHEQIEDAVFRRGVDLLDAGDVVGLRAHLKEHPQLVQQRVAFEGVNYFRNPTLLEFVAENPVRHGRLPRNVVEIARVLIDAGAQRAALNETLGLVCSGRVARECGVQVALIDLLCDHGAEPNGAMQSALGHGEFEAVEALIRRGACVDLLVAAGLGRSQEAARLLASASPEDRHSALALACQFGHVAIVRALLDAGEDPDRFNPVGLHSQSTPMHQAAWAGHDEVVRLLVQRGARIDLKDVLWQGTAADWAEYGGKTELAAFLRANEDGSLT
jgi:ankyrin repeat protein